jgi:hypothetical protein
VHSSQAAPLPLPASHPPLPPPRSHLQQLLGGEGLVGVEAAHVRGAARLRLAVHHLDLLARRARLLQLGGQLGGGSLVALAGGLGQLRAGRAV